MFSVEGDHLIFVDEEITQRPIKDKSEGKQKINTPSGA
jgi:hypothetical protein